jgi:hypothetical protein
MQAVGTGLVRRTCGEWDRLGMSLKKPVKHEAQQSCPKVWSQSGKEETAGKWLLAGR